MEQQTQTRTVSGKPKTGNVLFYLWNEKCPRPLRGKGGRVVLIDSSVKSKKMLEAKEASVAFSRGQWGFKEFTKA